MTGRAMTAMPPDDAEGAEEAERADEQHTGSGLISVVLADGHKVVAQGLATMLSMEDGIQVLAVSGSGEELLASVAQHQPDIALLDISLRGMDGPTAIATMRTRYPHTKAIVLSMRTDDATVHRAVAAGVAAYLPKDIRREELVQAIHAVASGKGVLHPDVTRPLLERRPPSPDEDPAPALSPREQQVLEGLARGLTTAEIAGALELGTETVKTHLSRLYRKLHVADRVQAVVAAMRRGLLR